MFWFWIYSTSTVHDFHSTMLLLPWQKEVMCLMDLVVCLFLCLSVCLKETLLKIYNRIAMESYGGSLGSTRKNWLNCGGDLGLLRNEQKTIIVVASPDLGADNVQEAMGLASHHNNPTVINAYCQAVTNLIDRDWGQHGVMSCLGLGGLHSLKASSIAIVDFQHFMVRKATDLTIWCFIAKLC